MHYATTILRFSTRTAVVGMTILGLAVLLLGLATYLNMPIGWQFTSLIIGGR